jgi:predicted signal transduction protein with EAL and GGDEF domain
LIVDFVHTLGLEVTIEGVKNGQQVDSLTVMRCDLAQGVYFSEPLPSEAADARGNELIVVGALMETGQEPRASVSCRSGGWRLLHIGL